jgi:RNA polymerase sigma-70 factor (ECF subfamily)
MTRSDPSNGDRVLVARLAAGDERALAELYDRYGAMAYSLACSILHDPSEAEEAASDAFVQVWSTAASFDPGRASVGAWISMITRTRSLDRLRARKRRAVTVEKAAGLDQEGMALPIARFEPAPDRHAEQSETRQRVNERLETLPEAQRRAIELAYFGGLSHSEIAEELNEPLGTVKTRIRSGMDKLRVAFAAIGGAE